MKSNILQHAVVTVSPKAFSPLGGTTKVKPSETKENNRLTLSSIVEYWGDNNKFPYEWESEIESNDTLFDAIEKEVDRLYAGGLEYGENVVDPTTGKPTFTPYYDAGLDQWLKHPMHKIALQKSIFDYVKHRFPSVELLFSDDKTKVSGIHALDAAHVRYQKKDEKTGELLHAIYSRNWADIVDLTDTTKYVKLPILDPEIDAADFIKTEKNIRKYFFKPLVPSYRGYYPFSPAYSAKNSNWLDISNLNAKTIVYMVKNQSSPKYHIEIDELYIANKYADRWKEATADGKNDIIKEELKHIDNMLHGAENTGKNVLTLKQINNILQKEYSYITITELKGSVFESGYMDLDRTAEKHIQRAVGIDPTLQGSTGSSGMGAGSGSDKREAYNIKMATNTRHIDCILAPFEWALQYNGTTGPNGKPTVLRMVTPYLQTLNNVTPDNRSTKLTNQ
jgi:hypothetical protein